MRPIGRCNCYCMLFAMEAHGIQPMHVAQDGRELTFLVLYDFRWVPSKVLESKPAVIAGLAPGDAVFKSSSATPRA